MLTDKQVILVKEESTPGTDASPSASTDAVLGLKGTALSLEGDKIADDRLSAFLSKQAHTMGNFALGMEVPVECRGGGIDGSTVKAPDYDALLRACGMVKTEIEFIEAGGGSGTFTPGETLTGGTSSATGLVIAEAGGGLLLEAVSGTFEDGETLTGGTSSATRTASAAPITGMQYLPTSDETAMITDTVYWYLDGHRHILTGSRADFSLALSVGQVGKFNFNLKGRFNDPSQQSMVTPTLVQTRPPLVESLGLAIGSYAPSGINEISLSLGNSVGRDDCVNAAEGLDGFSINDRVAKGSVDPKAESLNTFNPIAAWKSGTLARFSFLLGNTAGNRIYVEAPQIQYTEVPYGDREGRVTNQLGFEMKMDQGDDELRLVFF